MNIKNVDSEKKSVIKDIRMHLKSIKDEIGFLEESLKRGEVPKFDPRMFNKDLEKIDELRDNMIELEGKTSSDSLKIASLLNELDLLANDLEDYNPKLAYIVDSISDELETKVVASVGGVVLRKIKELASKIPGLPTKEEAKEILREFISQKGKKEFEETAEKILSTVKGSSKTAASIRETLDIIRSIGAKKVIGALIVMMSTGIMGVNQLYDAVMGEDRAVIEQVKDFKGKHDIADNFIKANPGKTEGVVEYAGDEHGIGIVFFEKTQPQSIARKKSVDKAMRALPGSVPLETISIPGGFLTITKGL